MSCSSCDLEINVNHDILECFGCGNKFHFTCLSNANKYYKKSLFNAIYYVQNLLWCCDKCLPDVIAMFTRNKSQQLQQSSQIPSENQTQTQPCQLSQQSTVQSNSLADLIFNSTNSTDSSQTQYSEPNIEEMDTNAGENESVKCNEQSSNNKRRRISIDSGCSTQTSILSQFVKPRFSSTNYRCIYLSPFQPLTTEKNIMDHILSQNCDHTEIMECKKLLSSKCNTKKLTFVSFKLTVHNEFYDHYIDSNFWGNGLTVTDFDPKPPKAQTQAKSQKHLQPTKFRVNPFAVRKTKSNIQNHRMNISSVKPNSSRSPQCATLNQNKRLSHSNHIPLRSKQSKVNQNFKSSSSNQKNIRAPIKLQLERSWHRPYRTNSKQNQRVS